MPQDNPIWHKELADSGSLEVEIVCGGLNLYNYDGHSDETVLSIVSATETRELVEWLTKHLVGGG